MHPILGLAGLNSIGRYLTVKIAGLGYAISVFDRAPSKIVDIVNEDFRCIYGHETTAEFVRSLLPPRSVIIIGGEDVDQTFDDVLQFLEPSDVIIEIGNERFEDTEKRMDKAKSKNLYYLGVGMGGIELGNWFNLRLMAGGDRHAYDRISRILTAVAVQTDDGAGVTFIGDGGSGGFVNFVLSSIENGEVELISSAYEILKIVGKLSNLEIAEIFAEWNSGELKSFFVEITGHILEKNDNLDGGDSELTDEIMDEDVMEGTEKSQKYIVQEAAKLLVAAPSVAATLDFMFLGGLKNKRVEAEEIIGVDKEKLIDDVRQAIYVSKICIYAQGMRILKKKCDEKGWNLNLEEIARVWKGGFIIGDKFLDRIKQAYKDPNLASLMVDPDFARELLQKQAAWRSVIDLASSAGVVPFGMSASLDYFDSYRTWGMSSELT